MSGFETVCDWLLRTNGPGIYAESPDEKHTVYINDEALHHESSGDWEVDIPLEVVSRLLELRFDDRNCTCGLASREPRAVMGHASSCQLSRAR